MPPLPHRKNIPTSIGCSEVKVNPHLQIISSLKMESLEENEHQHGPARDHTLRFFSKGGWHLQGTRARHLYNDASARIPWHTHRLSAWAPTVPSIQIKLRTKATTFGIVLHYTSPNALPTTTCCQASALLLFQFPLISVFSLSPPVISENAR